MKEFCDKNKRFFCLFVPYVFLRIRILLPPLSRSPVSLRLGPARVLTVHRTVIHSARAASLPPGGRLK